ncbi:hypothetical protein MRX96_052177 [Rhipicephalus microplus]
MSRIGSRRLPRRLVVGVGLAVTLNRSYLLNSKPFTRGRRDRVASCVARSRPSRDTPVPSGPPRSATTPAPDCSSRLQAPKRADFIFHSGKNVPTTARG